MGVLVIRTLAMITKSLLPDSVEAVGAALIQLRVICNFLARRAVKLSSAYGRVAAFSIEVCHSDTDSGVSTWSVIAPGISK